MDTNLFSVGVRWNFPWFSFVTNSGGTTNTVHFPKGEERTFTTTNDYLTNTRLTGDTTNGFTVFYSDGSQDVYGFIVTNNTGKFLKAFLTEHWNAHGQKLRFDYSNYAASSSPVIRLKYIVDGDGRTNSISYLTNNAYSTNLIRQIADPFGRSATFTYDSSGHLTNIVDVAGISSSFTYDGSDLITNLATPYGNTGFSVTVTNDSRTVLVTQPDGGKHLYLYQTNTPGLASSYSTNQLPVTTPFSNTLDNTNLNSRDSFYWGPRQYANLSTNAISAFTTNDFLKSRMKHWLIGSARAVGDTLSMEREPSPDSGGTIEGQKTWYDYDGKTNNAYEGTQVEPLFVARVLPDGTTINFIRTPRNSFGAVTNEVSTYSVTSGGTVLLRTNVFVYDSNNIDLLRATNALGTQVSSNAYNAFHEVVTNYNALGEMTVYTYDNTQRLSSVTTPTGLVATNIYGSDGFLAQLTVQGFTTNSFTWSNDLVVAETDARGLTVTKIWDNLQRPTSLAFPDGTTISNRYTFLDLTATKDRMENWTYLGYDNMRRNTALTNVLGNYELKDYCTCGALSDVRDAAGNTNYFYYDNEGRMTNAVYADGYSVTNNFNLIGQATNAVDSGGTSITNWFNNQGLQIAISNAFGRVQSTVYDALDRTTNSVDANGVSVSVTYDNLNRPSSRSYPDGGVENWGYTLNVAGATSFTNQLGKVTRFVYDAASRKIAETNANNEVVQFTYSGAGDLLSMIDGKNQTTTWNCDQFGRQTNKVDAANNVVFVHQYDPNNRLTNSWTPAKGNAAFIYDAAGNLTTVNYQHFTNNYAYDALNRLTNMIDAVGTTTYSYSAAGELLSEDGPWTNDTVSYSYANRLRSSMTLLQPSASTWTNAYGYDVAKRLTSITSPAGNFNYAYDSARVLRVAKLSLPNSAYITNSYDSVARLLSTILKNSGGAVLDSSSYAYNVGGQRTSLTNTANDYRNYAFDSIGQLKTALGYEADDTSRLHEKLGYAYDAAGNLNQRTNNALVQTFAVNNLNELSTVTRTGTLTVAGTTTSPATNVTVNSLTASLYGDSTFAKDGFTLVDGTTNFTAIAKDSYGRIDTNTISVSLAATNSFAYDLNGNMLTNGTEVMIWNDENELVTNFVAGAWKSDFVYDGKLRRRIERDYSWSGGAWAQTNEIRFIYDDSVVIQHRDSGNLPTLTLTRGINLRGTLQGDGGIGGLLAMTEGSGTHSYYHADGNGNVTCLINTNPFVVGRAEYDPYGNFLSLSGTKAYVNFYWFSSKPIHWQSDKYDFWLRWYSTKLDRFLNQDPIGERGGINLYGFVANNPISYIDPDGRQIDILGISDYAGDIAADTTKPLPEPVPVGVPPPRIPGVSYPQEGPFPPEGTVENPFRPGSFGRIQPETGKFQECWRYDKGDLGKFGWQSLDHFHYWDGPEHMTEPLPPFNWFNIPVTTQTDNSPPENVSAPPGLAIPPELIPPPPAPHGSGIIIPVQNWPPPPA